MLVLLTGLRAQEAAGLEWREVKLEQKHLAISKHRTKNGLEHKIPLSPYLLSMLKRRLNEQKSCGKTTDFVFPGGGKKGHYVEPKTAFANVSEQLGKDITPHVLRHTFATVSQRLLIHPTLQSKLLNHQTGRITDRYVHADLEMLREPLERINRHFLELMKLNQDQAGNSHE